MTEVDVDVRSPHAHELERGRLVMVARAAAALVLVITTAACSHESPVNPTPIGVCSYVVSPASVQMLAGGGTFQVSVNAARGCSWTVSTSDAWITPVSATGGQGPGVVVMNATSSSDATTARHGTVTVSWDGGNLSVAVDQPARCSLNRTENLSAERQEVLENVGSSCGSYISTLSLDVTWIHFAGTHGAGSQLDFFIDSNTGPERTGHVTTPLGQITIVQSKGDCVIAIAPATQTFSENGGIGTLSVTAVPGCAWEATPQATPGTLTIISGDHGSGNGALTFNLAINTTPFPYEPYFLFAGPVRFQITQSACPVTVSPLSFHVSAVGGGFAVTVMSREICRWSALEGFDFVTHAFEEMTGPGTVQFGVTPNQTGKSRFGLLHVANKDVEITQDP